MLLGLFPVCRHGYHLRHAEKFCNPIAWRRAMGHPMLNTLFVEFDPFRIVLSQHRIVCAYAFYEPTVARTARIGYDYTIEGAFLRSATR